MVEIDRSVRRRTDHIPRRRKGGRRRSARTDGCRCRPHFCRSPREVDSRWRNSACTRRPRSRGRSASGRRLRTVCAPSGAVARSGPTATHALEAPVGHPVASAEGRPRRGRGGRRVDVAAPAPADLPAPPEHLRVTPLIEVTETIVGAIGVARAPQRRPRAESGEAADLELAEAHLADTLVATIAAYLPRRERRPLGVQPRAAPRVRRPGVGPCVGGQRRRVTAAGRSEPQSEKERTSDEHRGALPSHPRDGHGVLGGIEPGVLRARPTVLPPPSQGILRGGLVDLIT